MTGSPDAGFRGEIALDIRDSEPDWTPYATPTAPEAPPTSCTPTLVRRGRQVQRPLPLTDLNHDAVAPLPVRGAHLVYLLPQQCCGRSRCDG